MRVSACLAVLATGFALLSAGGLSAQTPDLLAQVDPFVGAEAGGNTVPGAGVPFGLTSFGPDPTGSQTSG